MDLLRKIILLALRILSLVCLQILQRREYTLYQGESYLAQYKISINEHDYFTPREIGHNALITITYIDSVNGDYEMRNVGSATMVSGQYIKSFMVFNSGIYQFLDQS